jgi:GT2 family glycosyltransferase
MDLSIVIVSYNTQEMLRACLRALPAATDGLSIETFVVDNNSPDGSADMVAAEFPGVRLIANKDNPGFARANNQALRLSAGRHVLLLNPDTEAEPGSLTTLVRYLDDHPDAGAVGPKLLNTDGSLQHSGRLFPTAWSEFVFHSGLANLNRAKFERELIYGRDNFDVEWEVDSVTGACILARRAVMEQVGMLDEDFFMFYEEIEWCWRIRQAGWKIVYAPQARVVHHWMGSVRQQSRAMTARLFKSQFLYFRKTGSWLDRPIIFGVMLMGLAKNELLYLGVAVKRRLRAAKLLR